MKIILFDILCFIFGEYCTWNYYCCDNSNAVFRRGELWYKTAARDCFIKIILPGTYNMGDIFLHQKFCFFYTKF